MNNDAFEPGYSVNATNSPGIAYNITYNGAASVSVDLSRNFGAKANFSSDFLKNRNNSQINNFNTPNWKFNVEIGNSGSGNNRSSLLISACVTNRLTSALSVSVVAGLAARPLEVCTTSLLLTMYSKT